MTIFRSVLWLVVGVILAALLFVLPASVSSLLLISGALVGLFGLFTPLLRLRAGRWVIAALLLAVWVIVLPPGWRVALFWIIGLSIAWRIAQRINARWKILERGRTLVTHAVTHIWKAIQQPRVQTSGRVLLLIAEVIFVIGVGVFAAREYLNPDPQQQLFGYESEWLTSSAYLVEIAMREVGYIPLWQPYLETGEPLIENPFSFVLNPVSMIPVLLYGARDGLKYSVVVYSVIAGLGGWVLARVLRGGFAARMLLALLLIGKGNMLAMIGAGYYQLGASQAYFGWVFAGAIATLRGGRRWAVALTAIALTLMLWAGNIWYTLPTLIGLIALTITHVIRPDQSKLEQGRSVEHPYVETTPIVENLAEQTDSMTAVPTDDAGARFIASVVTLLDGWRRRIDWRTLGRITLAGIFTICLSAAYLFPLFLHRHYIGGHPDEQAAGIAVDFFRMLQHLFTDSQALYFEDLGVGGVEFYHSFVAPLWFTVLLVLLLPPLPAFRRYLPAAPKLIEGWRVWAVGLGLMLFTAIWAAGGNPLMLWLYQNIPGWGQWRFVGRALAVTSFWLAVLLTLRLDVLWQAARTLPTPLRLNALVVFIALTFTAAYPVVTQWELYAGTGGVNIHDARCVSWLRQQYPDQILTVFRIGYDAIVPLLQQHVRESDIEADYFVRAMPPTLGGENLILREFWPEFGIALVQDDAQVLINNGYRPMEAGPRVGDLLCVWWRARPGMPYAFMLPEARLRQNPYGVRDEDVLTIRTVQRQFDHVRIIAESSAEGERVVVAQETAYPGWQATLNGAPVPVESVGGMIGVRLPMRDSTHVIDFVFRPPLFFISAWVTLATAALMALYLAGVDRLFRWLFRLRKRTS